MVTVPVSHGDWSFSFDLTLEDAFKVLNARVGETIRLNQIGEQIYVQDDQTLYHTMTANFLAQGDGLTSEGLQREATLSALNKMIAEQAWDGDE